VLLCFAASMWAQNTKQTAAPGAQAAKTGKKDSVVIPYIHVYLGKSQYTGGTIPKAKFDELLKQGVTSRDSLGNSYTVVGFTFSYAERNLYEDSVGKLMIQSDYLSEYCEGSMLPDHVLNAMMERTKPKDTAYFDNITLRKQSDNSGAYGKPMRFVITR